MKLLIKTLIAGIVVIVLVVYIGLAIYSKPLLTNIASRVLHTDIEIARVKFLPKRLALQLDRISIPEWKMVFHKGVIHLAPLKLHLQGLQITKELTLREDKLSFRVQAKELFSKPSIWDVNMTFKNVDLIDLSSIWPEVWSYGFSKGTLDGIIDGTYSGKNCKFYGVLHFYNMVYNEPSTERPKGPLGIPIEEIVEFIQDNNGSIDLDFTYKGPLDDLNDPFRYRPGPKIIRSLGTYLIKKAF